MTAAAKESEGKAEPFIWWSGKPGIELARRINAIGPEHYRIEIRGEGEHARIRVVDTRTNTVAKNADGTDCEDINRAHVCPIDCPPPPNNG